MEKEESVKKIPPRQLVEKVIFEHDKDEMFTWKDIKHLVNELEDDDVIVFQYCEGYYTEDNSSSPYYMGQITRMVLENDEQYKKRLDENKKFLEERKKLRYESYLKLKKEFENEDKNNY